jgi:hypothetical protein
MRRWFRLTRITPGLLLMLALAWSGVLPVRADATPVPAESVQSTPLLPAVLAPPRWFRGADDRVHLVYELLLTNAFPVPVEVASVEVLDADDGRVVSALNGESLAAAMSLLASPNVATANLAPSSVGVVWFDIPLADAGGIAAAIEHRITVSLPPGLPAPATIVETGGATRVDLRPPVVIGPPVHGARWATVGSCCDGPHRRALQAIDGNVHLAQRFAIDFNQLDADNRLFSGDPTLNASYPGYGQPLLAVADAVVVAAVDWYPDQIPNEPTGVTLENAAGNYVILDIGDGRFATYAHLAPGSVGVEVGERVQRGQVIGALGNSGSSTGPHLHFHVMDAPSVLVADGLPYAFDAFTVTGQLPPLDEAIALVEAGQALPIATQGAGPRHDALPLGRDVVTFPD